MRVTEPDIRLGKRGVSAHGSPLCGYQNVCLKCVPFLSKMFTSPAHMQSQDGSDIEGKQEGLCEHMCAQGLVHTHSAVGQGQKSVLERWLSS